MSTVALPAQVAAIRPKPPTASYVYDKLDRLIKTVYNDSVTSVTVGNTTQVAQGTVLCVMRKSSDFV